MPLKSYRGDSHFNIWRPVSPKLSSSNLSNLVNIVNDVNDLNANIECVQSDLCNPITNKNNKIQLSNPIITVICLLRIPGRIPKKIQGKIPKIHGVLIQ